MFEMNKNVAQVKDFNVSPTKEDQTARSKP
jgi:hypothetical protein